MTTQRILALCMTLHDDLAAALEGGDPAHVEACRDRLAAGYEALSASLRVEAARVRRAYKRLVEACAP